MLPCIGRGPHPTTSTTTATPMRVTSGTTTTVTFYKDVHKENKLKITVHYNDSYYKLQPPQGFLLQIIIATTVQLHLQSTTTTMAPTTNYNYYSATIQNYIIAPYSTKLL